VGAATMLQSTQGDIGTGEAMKEGTTCFKKKKNKLFGLAVVHES
jgi:hypothetical protein